MLMVMTYDFLVGQRGIKWLLCQHKGLSLGTKTMKLSWSSVCVQEVGMCTHRPEDTLQGHPIPQVTRNLTGLELIE